MSSDKAPESGRRSRVEHFAARWTLEISGTTTDPEVGRTLDAAIRRLLLELQVAGTNVQRCVLAAGPLHRDGDMTEALTASMK